MKLPRGSAYKVAGTKSITLAALLSEFKLEKFNGYARLTVEVEKNLEDGYFVIKQGEIVAASYEGKKVLYGSNALAKIRSVSLMPGVYDVYRFSDFQLQITLEENKECLISEEAEAPSKEEIKEKAEEAKAPEIEPPAPPRHIEVEAPSPKIPKEEAEEMIEEVKKPLPKAEPSPKKIEIPKQPEKIEAPLPAEESEEEKEKRLKNERLKLLKKYGLSEPKEEFVESVVSKFYMPADYEIATKAKELKKEMINRVRALKGVENADLYVSTTRGEDIVEFGIDVYVKPLTEKIKKEIEKLIDETLKERVEFPCEKEITITAA